VNKIERRNYSKSKFQLDIPLLLEVQLDSFNSFIQKGVLKKERTKHGLESIFQEMFPITDVKGIYSLQYEGYSFGVPKYSIKECRQRGLTYSVPLRANLSLYVYDQENEDPKKFKEKITNDVFICELPIMTENGTFIINGAERVVVSQLHRSPGVSFDEEYHPTGKRLFKSRIIPAKGSWVEFLIDNNDVLYINIDRRKKIPATILMRALGIFIQKKKFQSLLKR
jgi:DNA-directed RNA polymerase subunit beta